MNTQWLIPGIVTALAVGVVVGFVIRQIQLDRGIKARREEGERILQQARTKAQEISSSSMVGK